MKLTSFEIRNLRSINSISIELNNNLMAFVGANSSGKSNIFRGIELFCTGRIDQRPFTAPLDMPTWIIDATAPKARSLIKCVFGFQEPADKPVIDKVDEYYRAKGITTWPRDSFTLIRYFTRSGQSGFQALLPGQGTRQSEGEELERLAYYLLSRIDYRYVPSLKDLQSKSFTDISNELKARLLSIWSGSQNRAGVLEKRERFQAIRVEIEQLIHDASRGLSSSLASHFPEIREIKLAMASTDLEDLIGTLDIFAQDGSETLMSQKGSGVQGASIIHMLRALRQTSPKGKGKKLLNLWNIEEPETFLHPSAQRKLGNILHEIASTTQILLTTHSPIFVSRKSPKSNVLLRRENRDSRFQTVTVKLPAEDPLKPVRESLGTSLADSLALHELVILVEGVSDVTIFKTAFERLCSRTELPLHQEACAFVSGHGASQQATAFSILKNWSPLSRVAAIFDFDDAGKTQGAQRLRNVVVDRDYFFLPHNTEDVVLEDFYSSRIMSSAEADTAICETVTIINRGGVEISRDVSWNKDQLANYFVQHATDAEWTQIESFIKRVITVLIA
jgi:putative ATP-dependent endonuclease of OLD family